MSQHPGVIASYILDNFERGIKRNIDELRVDEVSIGGMIKELINIAKNIEEKLRCISSQNNSKQSDFICGKRWALLNRNGILLISRIGSDKAISYIGDNMINVANGEYRVTMLKDKILFKSPTFMIELNIITLDNLKDKKHLIKIVLSKVINSAKYMEQELSKCIRRNNLKC